MTKPAFSQPRRGIILAGGAGTRLHPLTYSVCKQLLPVYDKPLIYYPLATMMEAGIRELLLITTPQDQEAFRKLLGGGEQWGISIQYAQQQRPEGIAQALIIGQSFIAGASCALILGDNIFHGVQPHLRVADQQSAVQQSKDASVKDVIAEAATVKDTAVKGTSIESADPAKYPEAKGQYLEGASGFAYRVTNPQRYGIVEFGPNGTARSIQEKPLHPRSDWAQTGLYFYDQHASEVAASLKPSARGELEITDVNNVYLERGALQVIPLDSPCRWFDAGTFDSLRGASEYVFSWQYQNGRKLGCPEEIAWRSGWIDTEQLRCLAQALRSSGYGLYLDSLIAGGPASGE